ncbi:MAG: triose-phosphate isomerase [Nanoarchaeota archaeon]|nr:triose-phosphate isomerase [Nanoarchaeota archaeon]
MIIINYKTYPQGTGIKAEQLTKKLEHLSNKIIICAQATDIYRLKKNSKLQIFAQNSSGLRQGRNTGFILPEAIKSAGANGTLLNHAEHSTNINSIKKTIKRCKELNLKTIVCVPDIKSAKKIIKLKPDYIAYEDSKLISTGVSISKVKPKKIKKFVELVKPTVVIPLCGSGISTATDVKKALEFGIKGILVASAIVKSSNPQKRLKSFLEVME